MHVSFKFVDSNKVQPFINDKPYGKIIDVCEAGSGIDQRGLAIARIIRDNLLTLKGNNITVKWPVEGISLSSRSHDIAKRIMLYNLQIMNVPKSDLVEVNLVSTY
jgi:hypothetical protein